MMFSVLLPTRNRLEYLRYAVDTVRRQDCDDWEIIISDNYSDDDIGGYVHSLADARIRYFRTETFVPVTENWNNALNHSTGDYVVMLGDDDGLLPGYFSRLKRTFETFPEPDFVYASAYFFAYPGVMPGYPDGFLQRDRSVAFPETEPFWLQRPRAMDITRQYLDFRMAVASNMQFSLISRRLINALSHRGPFFQSPFPDFYATPTLFLMARRILIYPHPLVVVGITPKSYGFFHFGNREQEGVEFLNNRPAPDSQHRLDSLLLPGTDYYNSWLFAMEALQVNFGHAHELHVNYRRYRFLQILHVYKRHYLDRLLSREHLSALKRKMHLREKLICGLGLSLTFSLMSLIPVEKRAALIGKLRLMIGQHTIQIKPDPRPHLKNIIDVFEAQIL